MILGNFVQSKKATTTVEKILVVSALVAIILSAGTLGYVFTTIEGRLKNLEEILEPPEQILVIGAVDTVSSIDPAWGSGNWDHMISHIVHEPPLTWSATPLEVVPALATSFEFSDDYLTCTLHLREGVKFHNGMPFNASALKYSFERAIAEAGVGLGFMGPINYDNPVDIVDDYTVRINLENAIPDIYPKNLAIGFGSSIVYPGAASEEELRIGTGPYLISEYKRSEYITLERFEEYWGPKPELEKIIIKQYTETTALRLALEAGEVDLAMNTRWKPSDIDALQGNPEIGWQTTPGGAGYHRFILFDVKRHSPLNNTLVRQAIAYAIDKERLLAVGFKGEGSVSQSMCPSWLEDFYIPTWEEYHPPDRNKARQLLIDAGYPDGFTTTLVVSPEHYNALDRDVALLIKDDLEQIGINLEVEVMEWTAYKAIRFDPGAPMALLGFVPDYPDPDNVLATIVVSYAFYGRIHQYNNTHVDDLAVLGASEADESSRIDYYHEIQEICAEELPVIPIVEAVDWAFYRPNVKNFRLPSLMHAWADVFTGIYIGS